MTEAGLREPLHCAGCTGTDYIGRPCRGRKAAQVPAQPSGYLPGMTHGTGGNLIPVQEERLRAALGRAIDAMDTVREGLMVIDPSAVSVSSGSILRHAAREARRALGVESKEEGAG